jgi:hypothetical protein
MSKQLSPVVKISEAAGAFAEDKDAAREIRLHTILPALETSKEVVLDFKGVGAATQSFIHALISEGVRRFPETALDLLRFTACSPAVKSIIRTVVEYSIDPSIIQTPPPPASTSRSEAK